MRRIRGWTVLLLAILVRGIVPGSQVAAGDLLIEVPFQKALEKPISASWKNGELQAVLTQLSQDRNIAIVRDRRINPHQSLSIDLRNLPLRGGLDQIARASQLGGCVVENAIYIGPAASASRLRTMIELRKPSSNASFSESLQKELSTPGDVTWQELDRPAEIVERIAKTLGAELLGEKVPHDLWNEGTLPRFTPTAALSVILIQFDLTFEWAKVNQQTEFGIVIRKIRDDEPLQIQRKYKPTNRTATEAVVALKKLKADLGVSVEGNEIALRGPLEEHEALQEWLKSAGNSKPNPAAAIPIKQRLFTLKVERAPLRAILQELEKSDVVFEFDAEALKSAGFEPGKLVTLDVKKQSANEFFKTLFAGQPVEFSFDDRTVRLVPRKGQ